MKLIKIGIYLLIFTLFFALWFLEKHSPSMEAKNHIQVEINSTKPNCTVTLTADGSVVAFVSMPKEHCNIYLVSVEK